MKADLKSSTAAPREDIQLVNGVRLPKDHAKSEYDNLVVMTAAKNFNDWTYDLISPYLGESVLEIGSGFATFTRKMLAENKQVLGLDINPLHIEYAKERCPEATFVAHDIASGIEPLENQKFDTAIALNVFEHIEHDHQALQNVAKTLLPGGKAIILVPAHKFIFGKLDIMSGHYRRYSRPMAQALIEQAGLQVVALKWFNPWSLLAMFFKNRIQHANSLSMSSVQLYDRLVPFFRTMEKVVPVVVGQSILIVGEKPKDNR